MTSSGTYAFNPPISDVVLSAYSRIQIRRAQLLAEHLTDAAREANYLLIEISNKQPNLWRSELQTISLVQGTATYALPSRTVMVLAAYIRTGSGASQNDRLIFPISTYEYASYPNKNAQGFSSVFWFDRQIIPQITLWTVPDESSTYTLLLQTATQIQDANLPAGETADLPNRFLDAFVAGLAYRLARIWKPELEAARKVDAAEAWGIAATQDVEDVAMTIAPGLDSYFR
jgi:hypothetical protein